MKILAVLVLAILLTGMVSTLAILQTKSSVNSGTVWYVGDPPFQFRNITEAINFENVTNGDIIEVKNRITPYVEDVHVNKSLTIRRYSYEPNEYPTVIGTFNVAADDIEINGFNIMNAPGWAGISLGTSNSRILDRKSVV
jgi:hypothetical protein